MDNTNPITRPPDQSSFASFADNIRSWPPQTIIIVFVLVLLLINTIVVDYKIFTQDQVSHAELSAVTKSQNAICSPACSDLLSNKFSATPATPASSFAISLNDEGFEARPTSTPTKAPTPTLIPPFTYTPTPIPIAKEFFVPLGTGSGNATTWTSIDGVGATLNINNYPNVSSIYFEVTIRIPTGNQNVSVRLYNATTNSAVANTTLTTSGGTSTLLTSSSITLPAGQNEYQVQIMTQLGYTTYIDQSRIHIITN